MNRLSKLYLVTVFGLGACDSGPTETTSADPVPDPAIKELPGGQAKWAAGIWVSEADWFGDWQILLINDRSQYRMVGLPHAIQGSGGVGSDGSSIVSMGYFGSPPLASPQLRWGWGVFCEYDATHVDAGPDPRYLDGQFICEFWDDAADFVGIARSESWSPLVRSPSSDEPHDIGIFEGTWSDAGNPGADVVSIDSGGLISGQHSTNGCLYSGRVFDETPETARGNDGIYDVSWTYEACTGDLELANEVEFTGMAFVVSENGTTTMTIVATGYVEGHDASLYLTFVET